jgi:hypothetical protein
LEVAAITAAGPDSWEVVVHYGTEDQQNSQETREPGTWHFNFGTTGGTHTITQSMQTIWRGQRSQVNPAPDLLGAVNYDGKIEYRISKGYLFNIPTHQT